MRAGAVLAGILVASCAVAPEPARPGSFCDAVVKLIHAPASPQGLRNLSLELTGTASSAGYSQSRMTAEPDDAAARDFLAALNLVPPGQSMPAVAETIAKCVADAPGFEEATAPSTPTREYLAVFRNSGNGRLVTVSAGANDLAILAGGGR